MYQLLDLSLPTDFPSMPSAGTAASASICIAEAVLGINSTDSASAGPAGPSVSLPNEAKRGSLQLAAELNMRVASYTSNTLEDLCLQMRTADLREGVSGSTEEPVCRLLTDHSEAGFRAAMEMLVRQSMEHGEHGLPRGLLRGFWTEHWTLHMLAIVKEFRWAIWVFKQHCMVASLCSLSQT